MINGDLSDFLNKQRNNAADLLRNSKQKSIKIYNEYGKKISSLYSKIKNSKGCSAAAKTTRACGVVLHGLFKSKILYYVEKIYVNKAVCSFAENFNRRQIFSVSSLMICIMAVCAIYASNLNFGYMITVNGKAVGLSLTKRGTAEALQYLKAAVEDTGGDAAELSKARVSFIIANNSRFENEDKLVSTLATVFDGRVDAYAIFIDNIAEVGFNSELEATEALELIKATAQGSFSGFNKDVRIGKTRLFANIIKSKQEAADYLMGIRNVKTVHKVQQGEVLSGIAYRYGCKFSDILLLNPRINADRLKIGDEIVVDAPKPLLGVRTSEKVTVTETIAYPEKRENDPNSYKGSVKIKVAGAEGKKEVDYEVIRENGVVVEKNIIAERILSEPSTRIVLVGSKTPPTTKPTGSFIRPFYGSITSRFGMRRGGRHTGIDIDGKTGDPIYCSDGGTIVFTGWSGGYGKLIKVSHGNGLETWYGHLSAINVKSGQKVSKKQVIGKMGNTGNSTGSHLHFEVRKNGIPQNPFNYVK